MRVRDRVEQSLVVVAHLTEGIPRFWLLDNNALETFVEDELQYGLQAAVEAKILTDVNGTSGIQTQAYATSVLATPRKGLTKLETWTPLARWCYTLWTGKTWSWRGPPATPSST